MSFYCIKKSLYPLTSGRGSFMSQDNDFGILFILQKIVTQQAPCFVVVRNDRAVHKLFIAYIGVHNNDLDALLPGPFENIRQSVRVDRRQDQDTDPLVQHLSDLLHLPGHAQGRVP